MAFPQFEVLNTGYAMDIAQTLSGSTADDAMKLTVTDTGTASSGTNRAFYISYTNTGIKTSTVNLFAIDASVTGNIDGDFAIESHYISQTGNKFTSCNVFGWQIYCEDLGTGVSNVAIIDVGRVMTNANTTGRDCFFRAKGHGGRCGSIFYLEGTSDNLATQFMTLCGCSNASDIFQTTTLSGSIVARLKVAYEAIPGTVLTQYYIPLYTS